MRDHPAAAVQGLGALAAEALVALLAQELRRPALALAAATEAARQEKPPSDQQAPSDGLGHRFCPDASTSI